MQVALLMQLQEHAIEACIERCVPTTPSGGKLEPRSQQCLANCNGAYMSAFQISVDAMNQALRRSAAMGADSGDSHAPASGGGGGGGGWFG
jgi:hypothetical protein